MTEKSRFWTTDDTGDGPAAGYTAQDFADVLRRLLTTDQDANEGVLRGVLNELAVTGAATPLSVDTGAGICYGYEYENSAVVNLAVSSPLTGLTGGRVNLKADWTAQTVRAVVQLNTDGNPAIPALVQTPGSEWSVPLATFTISTAGVITLTDARVFCHFATQLTADMIDSMAAYSVVLRAGSGEGPAAAVAATDNTVLRLLSGALGFGTITGDMIDDGAVTAGKIADNSVDDSKAGDRVPMLPTRRGGSASDWSVPGSTNYTPSSVVEQVGAVDITCASGATSGSVAVTFPNAFSNRPIIILSWQDDVDYLYQFGFQADDIEATGFTARIVRGATTPAVTATLSWHAIGPE